MKRLFKRRWLFLALIPPVFLAVFAVWLFVVPDSGSITRANYDKIDEGATTFQHLNDLFRNKHVYVTGLGTTTGETWVCFREEFPPDEQFPPGCEIRVIFSADSRVYKKSFYQPTAKDIYDRLLYRIKRAIAR